MKSKLALVFSLALIVLLAGCSKTYVCYDGSEKDSKAKCPTIPVANVDETSAGRSVDNYGTAVAMAKSNQYTRVNLYPANGSYYSTSLFTNTQTGMIVKLNLKIDGKTGDVSCIGNCSYLIR